MILIKNYVNRGLNKTMTIPVPWLMLFSLIIPCNSVYMVITRVYISRDFIFRRGDDRYYLAYIGAKIFESQVLTSLMCMLSKQECYLF